MTTTQKTDNQDQSKPNSSRTASIDTLLNHPNLAPLEKMKCRRNADVRFALIAAGWNPTQKALADELIKRYRLSRSTAYRWIDQANDRRLIRFFRQYNCYTFCDVQNRSKL
jgi:hypothetical protein